MEAPSFVSKARTAFHSAAVKAERVFSDLKPDRDSDKQSPKDLRILPDYESPKSDGESKGVHEVKHLRWRPPQLKTKPDWQDRFKNIRIGKKGVEDTDTPENSTMSVPYYDEKIYLVNMKYDAEAKSAEVIPSVEGLVAANKGDIPPLSAVKQLVVALEAGKKLKSMKDFLASSGSSSPVRERAGLSLSAVKSLVLRDKEDKLTSEFGNNENVSSLINSLFNADKKFLSRNISSGSGAITTSSFPRDIHGAPPESLIVKVAEVIGSFKTLKKMTLFWCRVVSELRRLWYEEKHIPFIPMEEIPDLNFCLLYQKLQVINCCVSRKRRRAIATESLDFVMREGQSDAEYPAVSRIVDPAIPILYAKVTSGELVLRLGVASPSGNLAMLETGEPVYSPITQEGPLLTEDVIRETEDFVLRTGSVGAGCSQLLSDMQAFKAANPGCILEDFVRWHSPPDWTEAEATSEAKEPYDDSEISSTRGQLSSRMQKKGNLWHELWETAKPVPAVKQAPLFDEDLAVEGILDAFEELTPSELFEQLFISLLGFGFVIAEARLSTNNDLLKLFHECKDYVISTCHGGDLQEKVDDLFQVYETVETMLRNPEEVLRSLKQPEDSTPTPAGEPKRLFKRFNLNFRGKDRQSQKPPSKDHKNSEENPTSQPFSSFLEGKSSLFSRKPPRHDNVSPSDKPPSDENEWTVL